MDIAAGPLLPPAAFALLALALLLARRTRAAIAALALLAALSTEGIAQLLTGSLQLVPVPAPATPPQAIVILRGDAPELLNPSAAEPGLYSLQNLRAGAMLQRQTGLPVLIAASPPGAVGMAASLSEDFHVSARWDKGAPGNFWQMAASVAATLQAAGIAGAYLVTDASNETLARTIFQQAGLAITPAPVRRPDPVVLEPSVLVVFTSAWLDSALALRQWAGLACNALPPCVAAMRSATLDPP